MKLEPSFVEDFLYAIGRHGKLRDSDFENQVKLQLAKGERTHGGRPDRPLLQYLAERREEAVDIVAWASVELVRLNAAADAGEIDDDMAHLCRLRMIDDCAAAQHLWRRMTDTFNMLADLPHN